MSELYREDLNDLHLEVVMELNQQKLLDSYLYVTHAPVLIKDSEDEIKKLEEEGDNEEQIEALQKNLEEINGNVKKQEKFVSVFRNRYLTVKDIYESDLETKLI